jgi:hypothetical protein
MTVTTLFGSWREGLAAAGVGSRRRRWDPDAIDAALRKFALVNDRAPTSADLQHEQELPSPGTVRAHYGSLQAALDAANLRVQRRRWDHDLIVGAILRYARDHGRLPTSRDWNRSTASHPHATTVLQQFGSWSAAMAAASAQPGSAADPSQDATSAMTADPHDQRSCRLRHGSSRDEEQRRRPVASDQCVGLPT